MFIASSAPSVVTLPFSTQFGNGKKPWQAYSTPSLPDVVCPKYLYTIPRANSAVFKRMLANLKKRPAILSDSNVQVDDAPKLTIGKSGVSPGNGLFAKKLIYPGEKVIKFQSVTYPKPLFFRMPVSEYVKHPGLKDWDNDVGLNQHESIVWPDFQKISCLNHAVPSSLPALNKLIRHLSGKPVPEPNIELDWDASAFVAKRLITPGEEILANYWEEPSAEVIQQDVWRRSRAWVA